MPLKVSELVAATLLVDDDLLYTSQYVSPGVYISKKITYGNVKTTLKPFVQNGNTFGQAAVLGTNDNFEVRIEVNGVSKAIVNTSGTLLVSNIQGSEAGIFTSDSLSAGALVARQDAVLGGTAAIAAQNSSEDINATAIVGVMANTDSSITSTGLVLTHTLNGGAIPASDIGVGIKFLVDDLSVGAEYTGGIEVGWQDVTHASRASWTKFYTVKLGTKTNVMSFYSDNILINGDVADFGSGNGCIYVGNAATVPVSNPTGGGLLYTEAGALKYRGSGGTVTTLGVA